MEEKNVSAENKESFSFYKFVGKMFLKATVIIAVISLIMTKVFNKQMVLSIEISDKNKENKKTSKNGENDENSEENT